MNSVRLFFRELDAVSSPSHHCHACRQDFGGSYFAEPTFIKELYFYVGGYFGTSHWVYLNTEKFGKTLRYAFSEEHAIDIRSECVGCNNMVIIPIDERWFEFNKDLLRCYFLDWESHYINTDIMDGTQWVLNVTFDNVTKIERHGSNAYPPHWKKFVLMLHKYGLPIIE